jgi:hypothetical protein
VKAYGAVDQGEFLQEMGISTRLGMLLQSIKDLPDAEEKAKTLITGAKRLVYQSEMGSTYPKEIDVRNPSLVVSTFSF